MANQKLIQRSMVSVVGLLDVPWSFQESLRRATSRKLSRPSDLLLSHISLILLCGECPRDFQLVTARIDYQIRLRIEDQIRSSC